MKNFKLLSLLLAVLCSFLSIPLYCQWLEATIPVGNRPWTLIYNTLNNKVYCANLYSDNVTVIDKYNSVIATIPVRDRPFALVYNFLNNKVYCANQGSDNVTVIDGTSDTVIKTITVGSWAYALVYNSLNNKVYCANRNSGNVTVINGTTDSVITTIPVGIYPLALVYNSTNKKVYCANDVSDNVTVIDGVSDTVIKTITVGVSPRAFTWNPIQNRVYVANYGSNTVSVIRDSIIIGIEEVNSEVKMQSSKSLEVYPNPAKSMMRVRYPWSAEEKTDLKIFNVSGKLVKVEKKVTCEKKYKQEMNISLKGINPGIYFLQIEKEVKKFLVVR